MIKYWLTRLIRRADAFIQRVGGCARCYEFELEYIKTGRAGAGPWNCPRCATRMTW